MQSLASVKVVWGLGLRGLSRAGRKWRRAAWIVLTIDLGEIEDTASQHLARTEPSSHLGQPLLCKVAVGEDLANRRKAILEAMGSGSR